MLHKKCIISGKLLTGSMSSTYSAHNSTNNATYKSQDGVCSYHKKVELFRTGSPHIPVKDLREFTLKILSKNLEEMYFEIVAFRGKFRRTNTQMDKYVSFLKS